MTIVVGGNLYSVPTLEAWSYLWINEAMMNFDQNDRRMHFHSDHLSSLWRQIKVIHCPVPAVRAPQTHACWSSHPNIVYFKYCSVKHLVHLFLKGEYHKILVASSHYLCVKFNRMSQCCPSVPPGCLFAFLHILIWCYYILCCTLTGERIVTPTSCIVTFIQMVISNGGATQPWREQGLKKASASQSPPASLHSSPKPLN